MIPFRRPFLDYVLSALADAGCSDVCLVIGPEHDVIRDYYERASVPRRVRVSCPRSRRRRAAPPTPCCRRRSSPAAIRSSSLNSDNYYPVDVLRALVALDGPACRRSLARHWSLVAISILNASAVMRC